MITKTIYICEICERQFSSPDEAEECEARGLPTPWPPYLIFGDLRVPAYHDMTFCVVRNNLRGHFNYPSIWATRTGPVGDSLDDETCGGGAPEFLTARMAANPDLPTFKRMVQYLREKNLPVHYWDGEKIIEVQDGPTD